MKPTRPRSHHRCRHGGFSMSEMIIAILIATITMTTVVQLTASANRRYRLLDDQSIARREVANIMEDLMSRPWSELVSADTIEVPLSKKARTALANATVQVTLSSPKKKEAAGIRRIQIQLEWSTISGRPAAPVQLVAWRYQYEESQP